MKTHQTLIRNLALTAAFGFVCSALAQTPDNPPQRDEGFPPLFGPGGPGGPGGRRGGFGPPGQSQMPAQPGPKLSPADVKSFPDAPAYDLGTLRTFFLEFEDADWEKELADFKDTDVEVPAKLIVDGKTYPDVGVHFHGMSSFMMVGEGQKRSLVVSLDFVHPEQHIGGYHKFNLLTRTKTPRSCDRCFPSRSPVIICQRRKPISCAWRSTANRGAFI